MRPEQPECQCLACAQLQHHQANDQLLLVAIATVVVVGGLVWLVGQVAGLLTSGSWPEVTLAELPGIPVRLRDHAGHPAADVRERLPGPLAMYATLAGVLATPLALWALAWWLHQPPAPPRPPATPAPRGRRPRHRPRTRAYPCCRRPSTTGRGCDRDHPPCRPGPAHRPWEQWRDAQERAATNPMARVGGSAPIIRVSSQSSTGREDTWRMKQAPLVRARPASRRSCSR